jgi:nucleoside-diphosphate-sugar epimerase
MKIYATGVTGTIGKHLASQVSGIDIDLLSPQEDFKKLSFNASDCIIHLAGVVGSSMVEKELEKSYQINVEGTKKLALAALDGGVGRFVYVSTSQVYKPSTNLLSEESEIGPSNVYAHQKYEAELAAHKVFQGTPNKLCVVRVFSVLDWDVQNFTLGGGIKKLAKNDPGFVLGDSDDVRDFLTPKRIAEVLIEIANEPGLTGVVNLCTGHGLTVRAAATRMLTESGFVSSEDRIRSGKSGVPLMVGDNSKLLSYLPNLILNWQSSKLTGL